MLRNKVGPSFDPEKGFLLVFFKISFSLQNEVDFWKQKEKNREQLDQVLTQKKAIIFGPSFDSTAYIYVYIYMYIYICIYICIYIYAVKLKTGPRFGVL